MWKLRCKVMHKYDNEHINIKYLVSNVDLMLKLAYYTCTCLFSGYDTKLGVTVHMCHMHYINTQLLIDYQLIDWLDVSRCTMHNTTYIINIGMKFFEYIIMTEKFSFGWESNYTTLKFWVSILTIRPPLVLLYIRYYRQ